MRLNHQLAKLNKIERDLDQSVMTDQQVDDEIRMLKLVMASRVNEDQSVLGGTMYSRGTINVNKYDLDSAILQMDESKLVQMNLNIRDRGESLYSQSIMNFNQYGGNYNPSQTPLARGITQ